ncbi:MAG TPA: response regulator transcription factor [Oligoflexia bacterium]|nr:response regulator transcription factor [Oligoflexia bacterium]HMR25283.1 response regulator transcription factor [Oligoflexia bacterium]
MVQKKILVVEDHKDISDILAAQLAEEFKVFQVYDGEEALDFLAQNSQIDLLLLDIMMPKINGLDVCKRLRKNTDFKKIGIIMLSAKSDEESVVKALSLGADDYVTKPFRSGELKARVHNVLKRYQHSSQNNTDTIQFKTLVIDKSARAVKVDGKEVHLTKTEFDMLWCFISKPERVYTRDQLLDAIKGEDAMVYDRNIDVHMFSLRKKIKPYGNHIKTIRSIGYRFITELE